MTRRSIRPVFALLWIWLAALGAGGCAAPASTASLPAPWTEEHAALARELLPPAAEERILLRLHATPTDGPALDFTVLVLLAHPDRMRAAALDELGGTALEFVLAGEDLRVTRAAAWLPGALRRDLARDLARALLRPAAADDWAPARTPDGRAALRGGAAGEEILALAAAELEFQRGTRLLARVGGEAGIGYSARVRVTDPGGSVRASVVVLERRAAVHAPDAFRPPR